MSLKFSGFNFVDLEKNNSINSTFSIEEKDIKKELNIGKKRRKEIKFDKLFPAPKCAKHNMCLDYTGDSIFKEEFF